MMEPYAHSPNLRELMTHLGSYGPAMVAYSGGVDSAMLSVAAARTHGLLGLSKKDWPSPLPMLAVVVNAESLAESELQDAVELAERLGFPYKVVEHSELAVPDYLANRPDRCYHCRSAMAARLKEMAEAEGFTVIVDGLNADDAGDYRPGVAAFDEADIRHPLMELGITKTQVRELARELDLGHIAEKPANACLASRVPHGTPITKDLLHMIETAEATMAGLGFIGHRVRYHARPGPESEALAAVEAAEATEIVEAVEGTELTEAAESGGGKAGAGMTDSPALARIEVRRPEDFARLARPEVRQRVVAALKKAGFRWVALDLQGYEMGSMNIVED